MPKFFWLQIVLFALRLVENSLVSLLVSIQLFISIKQITLYLNQSILDIPTIGYNKFDFHKNQFQQKIIIDLFTCFTWKLRHFQHYLFDFFFLFFSIFILRLNESRSLSQQRQFHFSVCFLRLPFCFETNAFRFIRLSTQSFFFRFNANERKKYDKSNK